MHARRVRSPDVQVARGLRRLVSPGSLRRSCTATTSRYSAHVTLSERVDNDLKEAMKAKDAARLGVLRMLKSAMKYAAIEKAGAEGKTSDAEAVQVIRKQVKQRQDSIESFEKGGRPELAAKEKEEVKILEAYLPAQMSPEQVTQAVRETIAATGATGKAQMGAVMKALQAKLAGQVDGKTLSQEVSRQLGSG